MLVVSLGIVGHLRFLQLIFAWINQIYDEGKYIDDR